MLRWTRLRAGNFSHSLLREAVAFGLPMAISELFGALFHLGDRFIIQWLLDERPSATTPWPTTWPCTSTRFHHAHGHGRHAHVHALYEKQGPAATSEFLRKATRFFFLFATPAVAGVWVISEDVVHCSPPEQFLPGASLVPILLAGFLLYGSRTLLGAGMLLRKRVWLVANLELAGAGVNLLLNIVLIPRLGIQRLRPRHLADPALSGRSSSSFLGAGCCACPSISSRWCATSPARRAWASPSP